MKIIFFTSIFFILSWHLTAQNYPMSNTTITNCTGTFYDSGGSGSDYSYGETYTMTFCSNNSAGSHIVVHFNTMDVDGNDMLCIFDGTTTAATQLGCNNNLNTLAGVTVTASDANASGCLTFQFTSDGSWLLPSVAAGWNATLSCRYPCQPIFANLASSTPPLSLPDSTIDICPGDVVSFSGSGFYPQSGTNYPQSNATSTFTWDFGDGATATGQNVVHSYGTPGGYLVSLKITDVQGCQSSNAISKRVKVSTRPTFNGSFCSDNIICSDETTTLTGVVNPVTWSKPFQNSVAGTTFLPDGTGVSYSTTIPMTIFNPGQTLTNVSDLLDICMTLEHSYLGDLEIKITCPTGQSVILKEYPGGAGTFLGVPIDVDGNLNPGTGWNYCFTTTPTYGTMVSTGGSTLPAGNYTSYQPLSGLVGCELNGDWTITVTDNLASDNGYIFAWSIDFSPAIMPLVWTFTPVFAPTDQTWNPDSSISSTVGNTITVGPFPPTTNGMQSYTFTAIDDLGCSYDTTINITVSPMPTSVFTATPASLCIGQQATITYTGTPIAGATYTWNFDGGTAVPGAGVGPHSVSWATAGTKNITLTVSTNGCTSTLTTANITVNPMPTSVFTVSPATICTYDSSIVTYTGTQIVGANYTWNFDGGTIVSGSGVGAYEIEWSSAGTKNLTLTVSANGCTSTQSAVSVIVNPEPTSNFVANISTVCENQSLAISYTGTQLTGATYNWNFDGGTAVPGAGVGPHSVSWATAGTKNITLTVSTNGCTSTLTTANITVNPMPTSVFTVSPATICTYDSSVVTYTGTQIPGAIYTWNFNGGTAIPGSGAGPHIVEWTTAGTKNITLTVYAAICTSTQSTQTVTVNAVPESNFIVVPNSVCIGASSQLSYISNPIAGATYIWDFAGGTALPGSGVGPQSVSWNTAGVMDVELVVMSNGCISPVTTVPITVKVIPTSDFTVESPVCAGSNSNIIYIGTAPSNATFTWNWANGLLVTSDTTSYKVKWNTAGTYNVALTVIQNGCTSSVTTHPVRVSANPTSTFNVVSPVCVNNQSLVSFTGSASTVATYFWTFGAVGSGVNAVPGTGSGPHLLNFTTPGVVTITLLVTDSACASQSTTHNILVSPVPTSDFTATSKVCAYEEADIVYLGLSGSGAIYHWDFKGGIVTSGQGKGPYKVYWENDSTYSVSLVVIENNCYSDTNYAPIIVNPLPEVQFSVDKFSGCQPLTIKFKDLTNPFGLIYDWNFGDSLSPQNTSQLQNPTHVYNNDGVYTVSLKVLSSDSCEATYSAFNLIQVYPKPIADFIVHPEIGSLENPDIDFFPSSSSYNVVKWTWNFGDPTSGLFNTSSEENPKHSFTVVDTFRVYLIVESDHQCKDTVDHDVVIKDIYTLYVPNAFTPNDDFVNDEFGPQGQYYDPDSYLFVIYDRWGEDVFKTNNFEKKWNGKANGGKKVAQAGVYNWMIIVKELNGVKHKYLGQVLLVP